MPASMASRLRIPDRYFELVKEFPLVPIRDDGHLTEAEAVLHHLLAENLDEGAEAYLAVLTDLVESYEDEHHKIGDASEASVLRLLMQSNDFTQAELARRVGISASTISAVLSGGKSLTRRQIEGLASFFHVAPGVFLPGT